MGGAILDFLDLDWKALAGVITTITGLTTVILKFSNKNESKNASPKIENNTSNASNENNISTGSNITTVVINQPSSSHQASLENKTQNRENNAGNGSSKKKFSSIEDAKLKLKILFIDDKKFKVVDTLKLGGWSYVESHQDVSSLDEECLKNAHFIFVDIQGVGKKMGFKDEGLGLAKAILERHPSKYLVIYSAIPKGHRFHPSLRGADDFLSKNADDYEFEKCIIDLVTNEI